MATPVTILGRILRFFLPSLDPPPIDRELLARCVRIIRGEDPGGQPRSGGAGTFPAWGEAELEGRMLLWSGPFEFALSIESGVSREVLPNVYVTDHTVLGPDSLPTPLFCFIVGESATLATLWPNDS